MAFTTYAALYQKALDALADQSKQDLLIAEIQNSHDMRTMYTKLGNYTAFLDWLKAKVSEEQYNNGYPIAISHDIVC